MVNDQRSPKIISAQVTPETPIRDVMATLGKSIFNIAIVVDSDRKAIGCVTDGDVRRGLLNGVDLSAPVLKIMRTDFIFATADVAPNKILTLMRKRGVRQIPILDSDRRLLDVKVLEDFLENQNVNLPAVIMAGGKGTRLRPFTETTPKPLLKIGDKPVIERIIESLASAGVQKIFITVNYLAEQIIAHLGEGTRLGVSIEYIKEPSALGTAGSLGMLRDKISTDFLVTNGDMLTTVDLGLLQQFHEVNKSAASVCSKIVSIKVPYGVMKTSGQDVVSIEEKPELAFNVSSGIYLLSPKVFSLINDGEFLDMPHLIDRLITAKQKVTCFQSTEPWIDIGSHDDFKKAQKFMEYLTL